MGIPYRLGLPELDHSALGPATSTTQVMNRESIQTTQTINQYCAVRLNVLKHVKLVRYALTPSDA